MDYDKLYAARLLAARERPYLATALFALRVVESRSVPTMGVDRYWRCYVSPAFVARRSLVDLAGVWVHEVSHLLRDHPGRGDDYARRHGVDGPGERLRMNIAADAEINDDVYDERLPAPADAVLPSSLGLEPGQVMEWYLGRFTLGPRTQAHAWLDCGGGADGRDRAWELGAAGAHGLTAAEREAIRFRVARGLVGTPGEAPDGWRRWAERVVHPPQPWRDLLGAAVRSAATTAGVGEDYTYQRPARRAAGVPGVVLPALRRRPPTVCVVVDTSGSVADHELGSALLEVAAIGRALGGRRDLVTVMSCDAAVSAVGRLCREEDIPLVGGGGTDLREGFAAALKRRPDVIVTLTDGQTPWPSTRPAARTVIGLFSRPARRWVETPPWARVVRIG
ncbi:vWA domain-containing protein [Catenuloplanes atrovinosus]|uniref:Metal-dependent peptidase n=1 Tax=Catenuloplanes atrovinosus TaxID=137266 RepID=A0AAE3YSE9_9ACTN|nr:VWA-like domain-containing protein [Catenuloplanes atrovinosus]MDR7277772.1 putative metal-dependent peptidase [Catenuloplanes atrovinosus]